jgi:methylated-DNA-[protein]-cysteine S-methyltransferase
MKAMNATTHYAYLSSPVGELLMTSDGCSLTGLHFPCHHDRHRPQAHWRHDDGPFREVVRQLRGYFAGELKEFDLPLAAGGTPFEQRVWRELLNIGYGVTVSYGDIARAIGKPTAFRAVGLANGRNPIPIIVPCHRVIGSSGSLTGYGGGLATKQRLLTLEGVELDGDKLRRPLAAAR